MKTWRRIASLGGLLLLLVGLMGASLRAQPQEALVLAPRIPESGSGNTGWGLLGVLGPPVLGYGTAFGGIGPDAIHAVKAITAEEIARLPGGNRSIGDILCAAGHVSTALPGLQIAGKKDAFVGCVRAFDGVPVWVDQFGGPEDDEVKALHVSDEVLHIAVNLGSPPTQFGAALSGAINVIKGKKECAIASYNILTGEALGARYISSEEDDFCNDLASDGKNLWVVGSTFGEFPTLRAIQTTRFGDGDGFVAGFSTDLKTDLAFSWLASSGLDLASSVDVVDTERFTENRWGPGRWKVAIGGLLSGNGLITTEDAFQRFHYQATDTYVQVLGYDKEDLSLGLQLNYSSIYGGADHDLLADIRWAGDGGLGAIWSNGSPDINTLGRPHNGADDGIFSYMRGKGLDPEKQYIGISSQLNRPLALKQDPLGTWAIGGTSTYPEAGPSWQLYLDELRRPLTHLLSGYSGVTAWYSDIDMWPMWTSAVGTTFGPIRVTDNALQPDVEDPPDGYLHCMRRPYSSIQVLNTTDAPLTLNLGDRFTLNIPARSGSRPVPMPWREQQVTGTLGGSSLSGAFDLTTQPAFNWILPDVATDGFINVPSFDVHERFVKDHSVDRDETVFGFINLSTASLRFGRADQSTEHQVLEWFSDPLAYGESAAGGLGAGENLVIDDGQAVRTYRIGVKVDFAAAGKSVDESVDVQLLPRVLLVQDASAASASVTASPFEMMAFDESGNRLESVEVTDSGAERPGPGNLRLEAFPSPFSEKTTVRYSLPHEGEVSLDVFDLFGRKVRALRAARDQAGTRTLTWDGRSASGHPVSAGAYFIRLHSGQQALDLPVLVVR